MRNQTYMRAGKIYTTAEPMLVDVMGEDPDKDERKRRKAEKKEAKARKKQWNLWLKGEIDEVDSDVLSKNRLEGVI